jgi:hypothetical protein
LSPSKLTIGFERKNSFGQEIFIRKYNGIKEKEFYNN